MKLHGTTLIERVLGHVPGVPADFAEAHHQFAKEGRLIITGSHIYSVRLIYSFI